MHEAVPAAIVRWRYRLVLDGLAVVLPRAQVPRLAALPGVVRVYPSVRYRALLAESPSLIGASERWRTDLANGGRGIKIGIIDDGIDASHPFFDPAGFTMPNGFPKGRRAFTTAKVIVARAFPPPGADWRFASRPLDPVHSFHGMHVAGIAAGNADTPAPGPGGRPRLVSGVAPLAYLGNYKALTIPTASDRGLNGNSPEIVAAIEAAVADGMDVINLSLGEPEIEPSRDAVAHALDNAAAAGVIPVVAAGNEFLELGRGSVGSPGTAAGAITVGAVTSSATIAAFSASGPTPLGLALKPDVSAPGVDVLSAQPGGRFGELSGTSMASPHVAGAAALLKELHPEWTVEQVKSALVTTGRPVEAEAPQRGEVASTRQGGGLADAREAADPRLFASPESLSFGLLDAGNGGKTVEKTVELTDAGGGAGTWQVSVDAGPEPAPAVVSVPGAVEVPGTLTVAVAVEEGAAEGERTGFIVLEQGGTRRRLPFWFRVTRPELEHAGFTMLARPGMYRGNTRGHTARVDSYRYPEGSPRVRSSLPGPEQVFRFVLDEPVANLGVAIVAGRGVARVEPRIVHGADENRLTGATALPYVVNPYLASLLRRATSSAALLPAPGLYSIVFDTRGTAGSGPFTFRFWIDDVQAPSVELVSRTARAGRLLARVRDAGSGVDPAGIRYRIDGGPEHAGRLDDRRGLAILTVSSLRPGSHRLLLRVSDRQEAKNNENVPRILPNTRVVRATITIP